MSYLYVAFDVETPNHMNNRISSIGITTVDQRGDLYTKEYLIDPECDFDDFNISLTGITPDMVKDAPNFPDVWEKIKDLFSEQIMIAHNANFDLSVLNKTLTAYGLPVPTIRYICTLTMAQSCLHCVPDYKLSTLCDHFCIDLNHHNAGSDSNACAAILLKLIEEGYSPDNYIRRKDFCTERTDSRRKRVLSESTQALNDLNTIIDAISCDGVLTEGELSYLANWLDENAYLSGNYPYDRIYKKLASVLEDGVITDQEHEELLCIFRSANDPLKATKCACMLTSIENKNICLSGEFDYGSKDSVSTLLSDRGANIQNSVTRKTDILIVGGQGSSAWCSGNYGSKIKKALELQAKGIDIQIIREADFFSAIEG